MSYTNSARHQHIGARGPLQDEARRKPCAVCGRGAPSEPAHIDPVGKGYGDWRWSKKRGRWYGRVCPLCSVCHKHYDRNVVGGARQFRPDELFNMEKKAGKIGDAWALDCEIDVWNERHPYEQWDERGRPHPADLVT